MFIPPGRMKSDHVQSTALEDVFATTGMPELVLCLVPSLAYCHFYTRISQIMPGQTNKKKI